MSCVIFSQIQQKWDSNIRDSEERQEYKSIFLFFKQYLSFYLIGKLMVKVALPGNTCMWINLVTIWPWRQQCKQVASEKNHKRSWWGISTPQLSNLPPVCDEIKGGFCFLSGCDWAFVFNRPSVCERIGEDGCGRRRHTSLTIWSNSLYFKMNN